MRRKFKLSLKEWVLLFLIFVPLMSLHIIYTPWIFAGQPIEALEYHELKNEPPPAYAQSFAINHGSAIYYKDMPPEHHPIKRFVILGTAFILWVGSLVIIYRAYKRGKYAS